jgi:hypothetical protein
MGAFCSLAAKKGECLPKGVEPVGRLIVNLLQRETSLEGLCPAPENAPVIVPGLKR